jgi:hypothetical protein
MPGAGRRVLACVLVASATAAAAGCGPRAPQAPVPKAERVASALTGIAAACGESYQQHAFSRRPAGLPTLEASASDRATELAHVARENPAWVYSGETLAEIVTLAEEYLRACALPGAARTLSAAMR